LITDFIILNWEVQCLTTLSIDFKGLYSPSESFMSLGRDD